MRLKHIEIQGFRSIQSIKLDLDNLCALVGENSSGKSTILQAIHVLLDPKPRFRDSDMHTRPGLRSQEISIFAEFSELTDAEMSRLSEALGTPISSLKLKRLVKEDEGLSTLITIPTPDNKLLQISNVSGSTKKDYLNAVKAGELPEYFLGEDKKGNLGDIKTGIQKYVSENSASLEWSEMEMKVKGQQLQDIYAILPEPFYVPAFDDIDDHIKPKTTNILGKLLQQVFAQIQSRSDGSLARMNTQFQNITSKFRREEGKEDRRESEIKNLENQLSSYLSNILTEAQVRLEFTLPTVEELLPRYFELQLYDGVLTPVAAKGHGAQRTLIWALLRTYLDNLSGKGDSNVIFLVEEPELYLHPQAQRVMLGVLHSLAQKEQVIYSTHSAVFVNLQSPEHIRLIRKIHNQTIIRQISQNTLAKRDSHIRFLTWVDDERSELFFAKSVILVEGDTEKILFQYMNADESQRNTLDELGCQIVVTGGKFSMPFYCSLLTDIMIPYMVVYDKDSWVNQKHKEINNHIEQTVSKGKGNGLNAQTHVFDPFLEIAWGYDKPDENQKVHLMRERIISWREGESSPPKQYHDLSSKVFEFARKR